MKAKTIHQLFCFLEFCPTDYGYIKAFKSYPNVTIKVIVDKEYKEKDAKMLGRYIKNKTIKIKARNIMGECEVPKIGFSQIIQKFRQKEHQRFCPSQLHCNEMKKFAEGSLLNF